MAQLYFHCSNSNGVVIDQRGALVEDLAEARDHAACIVRSFLTTHSPEDWRDWMLHVSDELDDKQKQRDSNHPPVCHYVEVAWEFQMCKAAE